MRISTPQIFQSGLSAMQSAQARLNHTSLQMSTGRRILTPSDDPSGAAQSVQLDAAIKATEQFQRNGDYAQPRLEQEEAQIDAVQNALQRARELVVTGNNDTYNQENRKTLAGEIRQLRENILGLANTKDANGEYLFAGTNSFTQPFKAGADGAVDYVGADGIGAVRELDITSTRSISVGDTGKSVFMDIPEKSGKVVEAVAKASYVSVFDTLDAIATELEKPTTDATSREALSEASSTALLNIDSSLGRMNDVRASVGMRLQTLDAQAGLNDQRVLDLKTTLSEVRDLDYADAISRYKLQETVLQAAQQTYVQVSKLSLFDFL